MNNPLNTKFKKIVLVFCVLTILFLDLSKQDPKMRDETWHVANSIFPTLFPNIDSYDWNQKYPPRMVFDVRSKCLSCDYLMIKAQLRELEFEPTRDIGEPPEIGHVVWQSENTSIHFQSKGKGNNDGLIAVMIYAKYRPFRWIFS